MTLSSKREVNYAIREVYGRSTKVQKSGHRGCFKLANGLTRNFLDRLLLCGYKTKKAYSGKEEPVHASDPEFIDAR